MNAAPDIMSTSPRMKNLRTALAINRSIELLDTLEKEAAITTPEHHESKRENHLLTLLGRVHTAMFKDWQQQPGLHEPGTIPDANAREKWRDAVTRYLLSNGSQDGPQDTLPKLFDANGFVIGNIEDPKERRAHCAVLLADFYDALRHIQAFDYGNKLANDMYITALGKLPAFQAVHGDIDLRRLSEEDVAALHDKNSSRETLQEAFRHALDPDRTPMLINKENGYGTWDKNEERVAGIRFLSHTKEGKKYLVTVNGGLVPLDDDYRKTLESYLVSGKLLADMPPTAKVEGYLPGTEELRQGYDEHNTKYIDGFRTRKEEAAPLFCLDIDIMTGLRPPSLEDLKMLLEKAEGKGTPVTRLNDNTELRDKLYKIAGNDERLTSAIRVAYDHVNQVTKQLDHEKVKVFEGKEASANPQLFVSMGGAASGKSNVEVIAKGLLGENKVVVASLDEFRQKSGLYKVMQAANHHSDDYIVIEPFGNALRDWVTSHARGEGPHNPEKKKYNLLFDGTGIGYEPRYAQIVDQFKKSGFGAQVIAVDRNYMDAVKHVVSRFKQDKRALPWIVVAGKHSQVSRAMLQAVEDSQLDKFSIFANDGKKGDQYLVAETFAMENGDVEKVKEHQRASTLSGLLTGLIKNRPDSLLKNMGEANGDIESLIHKIPTFNSKNPDENVACLSYTIKGKNRFLMIYDVDRFTTILDKGLLNSQASAPEGIVTPSKSLAFLAGEPTWRERLASESPMKSLAL